MGEDEEVQCEGIDVETLVVECLNTLPVGRAVTDVADYGHGHGHAYGNSDAP